MHGTATKPSPTMPSIPTLFAAWLRKQSAILTTIAGRHQWKRAGIFAAIGVLIAFVLQEALIAGIKRYPYGNVGIMNSIMTGQVNASVLVSGSSRAMYHYDVRIIEEQTGQSAYNIGRDGTKLHEQLALLRLYLKHNRPPQFLIQNVDITAFQPNDDITDPKQYVAWLSDPDIYGPLASQKRYYMAYKMSPLFALAATGGMRDAVLGLLRVNADGKSEYKGYSPQRLSWNEDFSRFQVLHPEGLSWKIDPAKKHNLEELLELCRKNKIQVVLVYSPDFHETQKFFRNRNETQETFREIADRFQVAFWDYSKDPICNDVSYFYNSQHMNVRGASLFSTSLARRLTTEMVQDRSGSSTGNPQFARAASGDR
jgi:hypothetical protein